MQPLTVVPNLIDQVHESLVDAIAAGSLKPGERIRQEDLAIRLGVSRQPVSHALQILKRQGLVTEQGKRGLAIAPIEPGRIADLYEVRAALEELAARRAAQAVANGSVSAPALDAARKALTDGQKLTDKDALSRWIAADVAYHSALHRLSGNTVISDTVSDQWPHFKRCMGAFLNTSSLRQRVWMEHAGILDAIEAGAIDAAGHLARRHTENAGSDLVDRLETESDAA
jgi:DNA-binding GntR family transcriptional regulator